MFVSADTHKSTTKIAYAVVIGAVKKTDVNRNTVVLIAAANLINLTDQSLTTEEREEIILEHLGLGDGIIVKEKAVLILIMVFSIKQSMSKRMGV